MFSFKQFDIHQDKTPMKVGTDGVLIGVWAKVMDSDNKILDIGAGTGLIALMLAQRSSQSATIDAVEIDDDSATQARENIAASPWSNRVSLHNIDISLYTPSQRYDLIVSNPPFFCDSLLCPDQGRTAARHTVNLSFIDLITAVERLISLSGRFSLILPLKESESFEKQAAGKLHLWRRCFVDSRVGGDCKRVMSEYRLSEPKEVEVERVAIRCTNSNEYTQQYKNLTADFYLKF